MHKFTYLGGTAYCRPTRESRAGIVEMGLCGLIDGLTLIPLRARCYEVGGSAPAAVIRLDRALILLDEVPSVTTVPGHQQPAAFIVLKEQRDLWIEYSRQLAAVGVTRAVFLSSQADLAYRWAERVALQVLA